MKKLIAIILVLTLALCAGLTACGNKDDGADKGGDKTEATEAPKAEVKGEVKTLGGLSVLVPDGFEVEEDGNLADVSLTDPNNTNSPAYFYLDTNTVDGAESSLELTKEMSDSYGVTDVAEFAAGENTWKGITYSGGTWTVYQLMCVKGENAIVARICGYELESDVVQAILASLDIAAE